MANGEWRMVDTPFAARYSPIAPKTARRSPAHRSTRSAAPGHPGDAMLTQTGRDLERRFGIHHATIQIELGDSAEACVLTPETVV